MLQTFDAKVQVELWWLCDEDFYHHMQTQTFHEGVEEHGWQEHMRRTVAKQGLKPDFDWDNLVGVKSKPQEWFKVVDRYICFLTLIEGTFRESEYKRALVHPLAPPPQELLAHGRDSARHHHRETRRPLPRSLAARAPLIATWMAVPLYVRVRAAQVSV
jgi:hypothetical protein